jgi:hypothetical protein
MKVTVPSMAEEDGGQADTLEGLGEDAGFESGDIGGDVWEFRHWLQIAARAEFPQWFSTRPPYLLTNRLSREWCCR